MSPEVYGATIRAMRKAAGLTQRELGTLAGLHQSADAAQHAISRIERGVRLRSAADAERWQHALSRALGTLVPPPPVDVQRGSARGNPRGGDVQRSARTCPHCGGEL